MLGFIPEIFILIANQEKILTITIRMKFSIFCSFSAIFLLIIVFLVHESDEFTAGIGANVPGRKRSQFKVRVT